MIPKKILRVERFSSFTKERFKRPVKRAEDEDLKKYTQRIVDEVKKNGDSAIVRFTNKFDQVELNINDLRVNDEEKNKAYEKVSEKQINALKYIKEKIERYESCKLAALNFSYKETEDVNVFNVTRPIPSVGCYVPGGVAAYPSTLLMTTVPAKVAGVSRIIICSPPHSNGEINPLTLVAADIVGVDEIYRVGGAQAIAAMAYGTESIRSVVKIVGPGNKIVTLAKMIVSHDVAIDAPAGPSEILVLADETADPKKVALDMISQAEHSEDCISGLITNSEQLANEVADQINRITPSLPRYDIVTKALSENGFVLICKDIDQAIDFVNDFAPEHLGIISRNSLEISMKIVSAGLVLLGSYTPVSASDYCIGTNHVLPTNGFGRVFSGLSVLDFVRRMSIVECSEMGLRKMKGIIKTLAKSEGLPNHYLAVERRFNGG